MSFLYICVALVVMDENDILHLSSLVEISFDLYQMLFFFIQHT